MNRGHVALRKGRHSIPGQTYLVTFTTAHRHPHFAEWDIASDASRLLTAYASRIDVRLLAWVLMPDHWHGLLQLGQTTSLAVAVKGMKGTSARALGRTHPSLGPIWTAGYHDRALRKDEDLVTVARYLVLNPVRGGLVDSVRRYPFWDAAWL